MPEAARNALPDAVLRANAAAYADVILRSRYTRRRAAYRALARGIGQYVLIGAGFDSFALRRPAQARELAIYEVDHPQATQSLKRRHLLEESGVALVETAALHPCRPVG